MLATWAKEERQNAKRLSAAAFLISGDRKLTEPKTPTAPPSYLHALRERFLAEQQDAAAYLAAAAETGDACLCSLFLDLAESGLSHAATLRTLVELV